MRLAVDVSIGSTLGGVGGFDPSTLNPVAWYDFSDASLLFTDAGVTPVSSDGDAIYQANDKSVSGFHLTQSTLNARSAYKTGIQNGLSIGRFDGVDDWMMNTSSIINGSQNRTIFLVVRPLSSSSSKSMMSLGYAGTPSKIEANTAEIATRITGASIVFTDPASFVNFNVITKRLDGTNCSNITSTLDGVTNAQSSLSDAALDTGGGISIGASFSDATLTTPGPVTIQDQDLAESILYDYALSDERILEVVTWLNNKWRVF